MPVSEVSGTKEDQQFRTDHLATNLRGRAVRGGVIVLLAQVAKFVLQMGSTVVLARLLSPDDFGLVAMVAAFTGFISLFKDLGLSMATIQRPEITHAQVSTLFWINVALSVLLMGLSMALAPVVTWFYGEPRLLPIMFVVAATFVPGGLTAQHMALLRRQMRYRTLAIIEVGSQAAGVLAALAVVWQGGGYWALVVMTPVTALVAMGMAWASSGWRPGWPARNIGVRSMLVFGGNLTAFNTTNYFSRNADNALIGWSCGAGQLGLYNRAYSLLMLPLNQINAPLAGVVITTLSRLQADPPKYRHYYCRIANLITYATVPMLAGLAVLSDQLIAIVLGPQWHEASSIFAILAVAAIGQPLLWTAAWVHISFGRTYRLRNWGFVTDPLCVLSFVIGLPWGTKGVAISYAIYVNLIIIPGMIYALRDTPVQMRDLFAAVWCPFLFAAVLFGGALLGRYLTAAGSGDWLTILYVGLGAAAAGLLFVGFVRRCRVELLSLASLVKHLKSGNV